MHALVHPHHVEPAREWIDWFTNFRPQKHGAEIGLEVQEGVWAEKLAIIAILLHHRHNHCYRRIGHERRSSCRQSSRSWDSYLQLLLVRTPALIALVNVVTALTQLSSRNSSQSAILPSDPDKSIIRRILVREFVVNADAQRMTRRALERRAIKIRVSRKRPAGKTTSKRYALISLVLSLATLLTSS